MKLFIYIFLKADFLLYSLVAVDLQNTQKTRRHHRELYLFAFICHINVVTKKWRRSQKQTEAVTPTYFPSVSDH